MELIALTPKEVHRLEVLAQLESRALTQAQAASKLSLSTRQLRRWLRRYQQNGAAGLASKKRGRPPNNARDPELIARILEYCRGPYAGFGPTFAAEKLHERNGITINKETLRLLLIANKLWKGKHRKVARHLPRDRREQFGELIQADGSPHDWFEGRAPKCSLLCTIDDATGRVGAARFEEAETTDGYFALFTEHFTRYGLPGAVYVDRHEIFRINQFNCHADEKTQVGRALENQRFAIAPASPIDAHRSVGRDTLQRALCRQYERVLSHHGTLQLDNILYALDPLDGRALHAGLRIAVRVYRDGTVSASHPSRAVQIRPQAP